MIETYAVALSVASYMLGATILVWVIPKMLHHNPVHRWALLMFAAFFTYLGYELGAFADGAMYDVWVYLVGNAVAVAGGWIITVFGTWTMLRRDRVDKAA